MNPIITEFLFPPKMSPVITEFSFPPIGLETLNPDDRYFITRIYNKWRSGSGYLPAWLENPRRSASFKELTEFCQIQIWPNATWFVPVGKSYSGWKYIDTECSIKDGKLLGAWSDSILAEMAKHQSPVHMGLMALPVRLSENETEVIGYYFYFVQPL